MKTPITDTARLDWLERTDSMVQSDEGAGDGPSTWYAYKRYGNRNDSDYHWFTGPTIRAAIDAAMQHDNEDPSDPSDPPE